MRALLSMLRTLGTLMLTAIPIMFTWNGALVDAVSAVKPISYFQAIGLQILAMLLQQSLKFYFISGRAPEGEIRP